MRSFKIETGTGFSVMILFAFLHAHHELHKRGEIVAVLGNLIFVLGHDLHCSVLFWHAGLFLFLDFVLNILEQCLEFLIALKCLELVGHAGIVRELVRDDFRLFLAHAFRLKRFLYQK